LPASGPLKANATSLVDGSAELNILNGIRLNLNDMRHFGPAVVTRHLARLKNDRLAKIHVPHVGELLVRAGDSDMETVREIFIGRQYDLSGANPTDCRVQARYESILAAGGRPIIVDAGANIGAASLTFARQFPDARIVAVEPDPENAALLRRNLEGRPTCAVLEAAIGAEQGFVALQSERYSWATRTERARTGVPMITMDDAFAASGGDTPFIVKVDIEGFEKDLFATNTGWIERSYVIVIEPHDWMLPGGFSSRAFQQAMSRHPFELCIRGENLLYVQV
jgi:FkbM family methyltransferase